MQNFIYNIENSAKEIFRIYFDTDIHLNESMSFENPRHVALLMDHNGNKKFSLFFEEDTLKAVLSRLTGSDNIEEPLARNVLNEMATLILGHACSDIPTDVNISPIASDSSPLHESSLLFESDLGGFGITINDLQ